MLIELTFQPVNGSNLVNFLRFDGGETRSFFVARNAGGGVLLSVSTPCRGYSCTHFTQSLLCRLVVVVVVVCVWGGYLLLGLFEKLFLIFYF